MHYVAESMAIWCVYVGNIICTVKYFDFQSNEKYIIANCIFTLRRPELLCQHR